METPVVRTERNPCTIGAKSLFKLLNDNKSPEGKSARAFFERSKTRTQCNNVVPFKNDCWICGLPIDPKVIQYPPECEHVLPVAQGVIFLQLYDSRFKGQITDAMKLEYDWAHSICNNLKNSTVLIKGTPSHFIPDVDKIIELLVNVQRYIPTLNLETQVLSVQGRVFEVTDYINKLPDYEFNTSGFMCLGQEVKKRLLFEGGRKLKTLRKRTRKQKKKSK